MPTNLKQVCVQLSTSADNVTLLAFAAERRATAATGDRYLPPAGPTAANPPHQYAAVDRWDRRTDTVPLHGSCHILSTSVKNIQRKAYLCHK